jgi:hypothetical protein
MRLSTSRRSPQPSQLQARNETFIAPTKGLVTNINLAEQPRGQARILDNYFPTTKGVRPRLGTSKYATIDSGGNPVKSMWTFDGGTARKLFAADAAAIYDITTVVDKDVVPTAAVSSQTSGDYSTQLFSTSASAYQYVVNGADLAQLYDGSTWTQITGASSPAITGVTTSDLSAVWAHGRRLWFIEGGTLSAWYLPVDSVGGAAAEFLLSGVFRRGGELLFGTTWSLDSGSGMDDKCIFVSSLGEIAVYSGTDPSSVSTWSLDGVYDVDGALSKTAFYHVGGVPVILTKAGAVSMTEVIKKDRAEQSLYHITIPIEDQWVAELKTRDPEEWKAVKWTDGEMILYVTPKSGINDTAQYFVANLETGAFARWINYDLTCGTEHGTLCYVGTSDGIVYQIENGGSDNGDPYTCTCVMNFDDLNAPDATKTLRQARANLITLNDVNIKLSASTDYSVSLPSAPNSIPEFSGPDAWDSGLWDTAIWSASLESAYTPSTTMWKSIGRTGFNHALQFQQTFGVTPDHYCELISITCVFEIGGMVV